MLSAALHHVQKGLLDSGLSQAQVKVRQTYDGQYRGAKPIAFINHSTGRLERDGSRFVAGLDESTRRLWGVQAALRLELHFANEEQHDTVLPLFLTWLYDHSFEVEGHKYKLPDGPIQTRYTDEEGFLLGEFSLLMEIPYQSAVLRSTTYRQLEVNEELVVFEE